MGSLVYFLEFIGYDEAMSSLPLDIRRQAKSLVEAGKTSAEVKGLYLACSTFP
jgi:hypothetical protein